MFICSVLVLSYYMYLRYEFVLNCSLRFPHKAIGLYLLLFAGGFMSCLRYLCLFAYSGVQHILCCVFCFFMISSCILYVFPIMCIYVLSSCCDVSYDFRIKLCSVRLYLQLFVEGLMSYLCYLCLFAYSGVQHISCCVFCFVWLRLVSCVLCLVCPVLSVSLECSFFIFPAVFSNV